MINKTVKLALLASALAGFASVAHAQEQDGLTLSGNVGLTSDYRFRGVSQTDESVALQGGLDASYKVSEGVNFYVGTWGSTGDKNTIGASEIDVYGGLSGTAGLANWKLGAIGYLYSDAANADYYELQGELGTNIGPVAAAAGIMYAPEQDNLGDNDNWYLYTNLAAAVPNTPVTLKASLGYEDGAMVAGSKGKWDWSLGASVDYRQFTFGVAYVDTNRDLRWARAADENAADSTVVFSVGARF